MPAGELVTVPEPVPSGRTVSTCVSRSNFAFASFAAPIVTTHWLEPLTTPGQVVQTTGFAPASGVPVSLTSVPSVKLAWHSPPQSIPAGELVTVPVPEPSLLTLSWNSGAALSTSTLCEAGAGLP